MAWSTRFQKTQHFSKLFIEPSLQQDYDYERRKKKLRLFVWYVVYCTFRNGKSFLMKDEQKKQKIAEFDLPIPLFFSFLFFSPIPSSINLAIYTTSYHHTLDSFWMLWFVLSKIHTLRSKILFSHSGAVVATHTWSIEKSFSSINQSIHSHHRDRDHTIKFIDPNVFSIVNSTHEMHTTLRSFAIHIEHDDGIWWSEVIFIRNDCVWLSTTHCQSDRDRLTGIVVVDKRWSLKSDLSVNLQIHQATITYSIVITVNSISPQSLRQITLEFLRANLFQAFWNRLYIYVCNSIDL